MLLFVFVFVMVDQREKAESRLDSSSDLQGDEEEGNSPSGHGRSKREKESADLIVQFLTKLAIYFHKSNYGYLNSTKIFVMVTATINANDRLKWH